MANCSTSTTSRPSRVRPRWFSNPVNVPTPGAVQVEVTSPMARSAPGTTFRLAAATLMTKFDQNLQIEYTFAGTHPDYRRLGLMGALGRVMDRLVRASGAEYLTTFLETWHTITQEETFKRGRGWQVAGIFPGNFTRWAGDQQEYRACEVHLYQFVNEGEKYATRPEEWQLHPELQALWDLLETINARLGRK